MSPCLRGETCLRGVVLQTSAARRGEADTGRGAGMRRRAACGVPAAAHHPHVAQREVEAHRIDRVQLAKPCRDVRRHVPAWTPVARQPQALPQTDDVRVERDDEPRGRDARPDSEIDLVAPDHPAQKQVQPLARAAARRPWEEVAARRYGPAGAGRRRASGRSPERARENDSRPEVHVRAAGSSPSAKNCSIEPARSSI